MFFACWDEAIARTDNPLRNETFPCVYSTMTTLQFIRMTTSYTINSEDKKLRSVDVGIIKQNLRPITC